MAEQLICDRPHHVVIDANADYLPLVIKDVSGQEKHIDLCQMCGFDFQAFMQQNPTQNQQQDPAQAQVSVDPNAGNTGQIQGSNLPGVDNTQQ